MNYSNSDNRSDNSDQVSSDEKPEIKSIIREKTKIFQNESYAIKLLLSYHHRGMRSSFFEYVRKTHSSIYQAIKREIKNCLNPYRIFLKKNTEISNELKELNNLFKNYFKDKHFNNTFFVNYFQNLEKAHKNKSKYMSNLPKDEIETLNDIQRKVTIIKSLKNYLNTTVRDRIQINFEQKEEMFDKEDFIMMYKYMVIKENKFSLMNEEELMKYISNKKNSYKLRRPLNDVKGYNYIPILCKGYCQNEARLFNHFFEIAIQKHEPKCNKCKQIYEHLDEIKSQIRSIYTKTCIFSHNINEIMFHPLVFCSDINNPFYINQFNQSENPEIKDIIDIVKTTKIVAKYKNKKKYDIRQIYNAADNDMKEIYNRLLKYSLKTDLYGNGCYLPEYKTNPCPCLNDLFQPNDLDFSTHMIKCPYYHNSLEKRRNIKIRENEICKEVIEDGKWRTDEENIKCKNGDTCNKFHTRNELFYDERNFRKLYPCSKTYEYCLKGEMCPKKHPTDVKIDEIYLPLESRKEIERELKKLKEKNKKIHMKEEKLLKIQCKYCLNYIDGTDGRNLYKYINCNHIICSKCNDFYKSCPLCGLNSNYRDEEDKIYIILDYEKVNKQENEENEECENENDEENKNDDSDGEVEELDDIEDADNKSIEESLSDENFIFKANNEVTYSEGEDEDESKSKSKIKSNDPDISKENESEKSNIKNEKDNSNDENSEEISRSRGYRGRGMGGRGTGERGRGRGGRGRGGERGRGDRGRGGRGNINNNIESDESDNSSSGDNDEIESSSDISKSNKLDDTTEESMEKYAIRGRGNQRGRGAIRGRGERGRGGRGRGRGRGGRGQRNNDNSKEDDSENSDNDEEKDNSSMKNKTKKTNNEDNDEESD